MKTPKVTSIDFETEGVEGRPHYPPKPVGVSIKYWGKKAQYYAWGHPSGNNCTKADARGVLAAAYKTPDGVCFHNGNFDTDVAEVFFKLKPPHWSKVHDTMFLLFLDDPHQMLLGLKPASERLLQWPPEEQDAVADWLVENQPVPGVKISRGKSSPHNFGRYIASCPADIVGPYANGDVGRTEALFKLLYPKTMNRGMLEPYQREQELMPILLEMERQGLPVDLDRLRADVEMYADWQVKIDAWICKRVKSDINIDSGAQLMEAMLASGCADPALCPLTKTGKYSTKKESLLLGVTDKTLLAVLNYRASLKTCMSTFMVPWLQVAEQSGGLIFTEWNQVKKESGGGSVGARTGRLSSTPNFQNIPNKFKLLWTHQKRGAGLVRCPFKGLPDLPRVRSYIVPFEGEVMVDRDYSQQELRLLAHFEGGAMLEAYDENKWLDFHSVTQKLLSAMGKVFARKAVKGTNFGLIYGMGIGLLAASNGTTVAEAKELKNSILNLYPGLKAIYKDMKIRMRSNLPIRTWGGREYYCEPARMFEGKLIQFDYKMVNVLVQGSAADVTKQAIIQFHRAKTKLGARGRAWRILLNVHDQITVSVPIMDVPESMDVLRDTMEAMPVDVPMLSEGSTSGTNWAELHDYDKAGVRLPA